MDEQAASALFLRRAFHGLVNPFDPVQVLQELAAAAAKVFWPRPFHAGIFTLLAAVKMAAGYFEAVFRIQYDDFLACHILELARLRTAAQPVPLDRFGVGGVALSPKIHVFGGFHSALHGASQSGVPLRDFHFWLWKTGGKIQKGWHQPQDNSFRIRQLSGAREDTRNVRPSSFLSMRPTHLPDVGHFRQRPSVQSPAACDEDILPTVQLIGDGSVSHLSDARMPKCCAVASAECKDVAR